MREFICRGRGLCRNEKCLYQKAHTRHGGKECLPFSCSFLGATQHCEPVNKEGIMEDDRKGTWGDVTEKCNTRLSGDGNEFYVCGPDNRFIRAILTRHGVSRHCVEGGACENGNAAGYRVITDGSGKIRVEHFIPDPEPVIAYKAVIERDGEWVSTWAGGPSAGDQEQLSYAVGRTVTATRGPGVACFGDLESAREAFPSPLSSRGTNAIPRNHGRLLILEVQTTGEGTLSPNLHDAERRGAYCYPSVKVLSVAWEEEKKEEWVDVTKECEASLYRSTDDTHSCVQVRHDGQDMLWLGGDEPHVFPNSKYRVTLSTDGPLAAGEFKVEKRND